MVTFDVINTNKSSRVDISEMPIGRLLCWHVPAEEDPPHGIAVDLKEKGDAGFEHKPDVGDVVCYYSIAQTF